MKRRKINNRYLSERVPQTVENTSIKADDFAKSIADFSNLYLKDALEVEIHGESTGTVKASTSLTAYIIRMMLEIVSEDDYLHLRIDLGDEFTMSVEFETLPKLDDLARLVNTCRMAGFHATRDDKAFSFSLKISSTNILKIYAIDAEEFIRDLQEVFFM